MLNIIESVGAELLSANLPQNSENQADQSEDSSTESHSFIQESINQFIPAQLLDGVNAAAKYQQEISKIGQATNIVKAQPHDVSPYQPANGVVYVQIPIAEPSNPQFKGGIQQPLMPQAMITPPIKKQKGGCGCCALISLLLTVYTQVQILIEVSKKLKDADDLSQPVIVDMVTLFIATFTLSIFFLSSGCLISIAGFFEWVVIILILGTFGIRLNDNWDRAQYDPFLKVSLAIHCIQSIFSCLSLRTRIRKAVLEALQKQQCYDEEVFGKQVTPGSVMYNGEKVEAKTGNSFLHDQVKEKVKEINEEESSFKEQMKEQVGL